MSFPSLPFCYAFAERGERLQIDANLRQYSRFRFYRHDSCCVSLLYFPFPTKRVLTYKRCKRDRYLEIRCFVGRNDETKERMEKVEGKVIVETRAGASFFQLYYSTALFRRSECRYSYGYQ